MPFVKIMRDSGYADRIRAYEVWIDNCLVGTVRNGEVKQFAVASGHHNLRMRIDWCGSKLVDFHIGEQEQVAFEAKSGLRGWRIIGALWFAFFERSSWIELVRVTP